MFLSRHTIICNCIYNKQHPLSYSHSSSKISSLIPLLSFSNYDRQMELIPKTFSYHSSFPLSSGHRTIKHHFYLETIIFITATVSHVSNNDFHSSNSQVRDFSYYLQSLSSYLYYQSFNVVTFMNNYYCTPLVVFNAADHHHHLLRHNIPSSTFSMMITFLLLLCC